MCETADQNARLEMEAYDTLPNAVQRVFDEAPMKVSVYNTMRLPGVASAYRNMTTPAFAQILRSHLAEESRRAHEKDMADVRGV